MRSTVALATAGLLLLLAAISLGAAFQNFDRGVSPDAEIILAGAAVALAVANIVAAFKGESRHAAEQN